MLWERLTAPQLSAARDRCGGVCIIPIGSLEKHSEHLPTGNDSLMAHAHAVEAARRESAVVLPTLYYTQVHQAKNAVGAIAIRTSLLMELLENICDEVARNGFKKIIIFNEHGGNRYWIPAAITEMGGKDKDYLVALYRGEWDAGLSELRDSDVPEEHGGELETSIALALHPDCVDMKAVPKKPGIQKKVPDINAYSSVSWISRFPDQYSGDARPATSEKGRKVFEAVVNDLAKCIRAVKEDNSLLTLAGQLGKITQHPSKTKRNRKKS